MNSTKDLNMMSKFDDSIRYLNFTTVLNDMTVNLVISAKLNRTLRRHLRNHLENARKKMCIRISMPTKVNIIKVMQILRTHIKRKTTLLLNNWHVYWKNDSV